MTLPAAERDHLRFVAMPTQIPSPKLVGCAALKEIVITAHG